MKKKRARHIFCCHYLYPSERWPYLVVYAAEHNGLTISLGKCGQARTKQMTLKFRLAIPLFVALAYGPSQGLAVPILGADLASFAVLGASTVTNVPTSTIVGNVGLSPGPSITGFCVSPGVPCADPQVTGGLVHATTALAASGQSDLTIARTDLALLGPGTLLPADLVGLTIFPGVYTVPAGTTNLSGAVTLDGQGNANAAWVFQITSTLITSSGSVVDVINTGAGAGVFWNVGSSATLGSGSTFEGNILALASISLDTTAKILCGRALADTGAVTLIQNTISIGCAGTGEEGSNGLSGGLTVSQTTTPETPTFLPFAPVSNVPEPATLALLGLGLAGLRFSRRKKA